VYHVRARGGAASQGWMKKATEWFDEWGALQMAIIDRLLHHGEVFYLK